MKKGVIFVLFAMLLLAGCGTIQHEEQQSGDGSRKAEGGEWLTKEGTFIGLADQHTVAVNIDGKETMLQVPPEKRDKYKGIKESKGGSQVSKGERWNISAERFEKERMID